MSIARQLDMLVGDGVISPPNLNQNYYVNVARFFRYCASNGLCSIVASNYGSGGTGEDYHDGANPAGDGAWICAAWNAGTGQTFYVLVRWGELIWSGLLLHAATGNDGVGIMMAVRDDGTNPWNGTSNDDGSDTLGTPVWTDGGSTVRVFPRSNATGGTHATNKNNMIWLVDVSFSPGKSRSHFTATEDGLMFITDAGSTTSGVDGDYQYNVALGKYTPRTGLESLLTTPYFMVSTNVDTGAFALGASFPHGGTSGSGGRNGGICALPVNDVMDCTITTPSAGQTSTFYQPNQLISPREFEPTPYSIFAHESGKTGGPDGTGAFGLAGFLDIDLVSAIYNTYTHQTNSDGSLAWIGELDLVARKFAVNWDGGASPGTNMTREGRQSFQL